MLRTTTLIGALAIGLIMWDKRCVMHRATAYDPATQRRVTRRCAVLSEVPV